MTGWHGITVVFVNDIHEDVSGNEKADSDGFYKPVLHLHNENQKNHWDFQS